LGVVYKKFEVAHSTRTDEGWKRICEEMRGPAITNIENE
jgi:hypothetical protein